MKSRKVKAVARSKAYVKKLKGTIPLEREERSMDENEESEEEFKKEKEETSSEEEVLPIDHSDSSDDEENSEQENDDLPNLSNWGKKKSTYYNADFVDKDRGKTYREEDLEIENAEREAAMLQQQASAELDKYGSTAYFEDYDRAIELISKTPKDFETDIQDDESPEIEKLKHERKKHPKLLEYKKEFLEKFSEVNTKLAPILELMDNIELDKGYMEYVKHKYQIILHYLLNLSYYFYLKNLKGEVPESHPIYKRIEEFKQFDDQMNTHTYYLKKSDIILKKLGKTKEMLKELSDKNKSSPKKKNKKRMNVDSASVVPEKKSKFKQFETEDEKDILALYSSMREQLREETTDKAEIDNITSSVNQSEEENNGDKRTITYQIAKNKGLMRRRKKELRNPRVHLRMKYRKAKIRRKGQVREVIKEIKRYEGEPTGISAHVVRSVKLK